MRWFALSALGLLILSGASGAEESIWTNKPVRVDPAKQNFERLPSLMLGLEGAETVVFPMNIQMRDSVSFSAEDVNYVLKDLRGIALGRICQSASGPRWACGAQAAVFVGNLFRGRSLLCKTERRPGVVALSGCRTASLRVPFEIVARGFGFPESGDSDLEAALLKAKAQRAGVWNDAVCATQLHSC